VPPRRPSKKTPSTTPERSRSTSTPNPRTNSVPTKFGISDPYAKREAAKYSNPIPSREAILHFLEETGQLMTADTIAAALHLSSAEHFEALTKRLTAMVRDGQLLQNRRKGYGIAEKLDLISGTVLANAEGYGFLRPDAGGDDIYLSPAQMRQVLHGDRVLISIVGVDRRGRRQGTIVEVLERRPPRLVGRIVKQDGVVVVVPDDQRLHQDVLIPPGREQGARSGQIVVAEITEPPTLRRGPLGHVVAILGDRLEPSLVVEMTIASYGLPNEWPEAVLNEAAQVEPSVTEIEILGREDVRNLPLITIDGEDARDFDDAVYAEPNGKGFRLIVAIADVSHYVRPDTALDQEATNRSTSVYFPGFVVPMLPETLSNGICSLNPHVERLCMVADMQINQRGKVSQSRFYPAVMKSHARLTYNQVWRALGENDPAALEQIGELLPHLENLYKLYKILAKSREQRGAIDFETREVKFRLSTSGEVFSLGSEPRNDAHKLIEECMITANVEAAKFLERHDIPALFRAHVSPPASKYEDLLEFLREFGLSLPPVEKVQPVDYANLLKKIRDRSECNLIQSVLLRSQSLAVYQPENQGHFGLALDAYAHFTSPIRRYPDLLVHRAIRHAFGGGAPDNYFYTSIQMQQFAGHCSQNERRAEEAERDVDERYKCAWMEKHIGSEFEGIVAGVTSFGLFVELTESQVTGLVHITQLPNDYYHFDPIRHLLKGERRGLGFRLGDAVTVLVLRASLEDRKIDFRLVMTSSQVDKFEKQLSFTKNKKEEKGKKVSGRKPSSVARQAREPRSPREPRKARSPRKAHRS